MVMCLMQLCVIMHATTPDCTGEASSPASLMQVTSAPRYLENLFLLCNSV
jgi:hypothetical protein